MERQEEEQRRAEIVRMERESKRRKLREKEALIDELMFSQENAKNIINNFSQNNAPEKEEIKVAPPTSKVVIRKMIFNIIRLTYVYLKVTQFSTGVKFTRGTGSLPPLPQITEGPLYVYTPPVAIPTEGPTPPTRDTLESDGYLQHMKWVTIVIND